MQILVFKTNVRYKKQVVDIANHLNTVPDISKWNFDLHDTDKILRIETHYLPPKIVERTLQDAGYYCEELED